MCVYIYIFYVPVANGIENPKELKKKKKKNVLSA